MPDVYIGSNAPPTWADPVGQPSRDRTTARGNFQATPVVHRAERLHVAFRSGVENSGQRIETARGLRLGVVEDVVDHRVGLRARCRRPGAARTKILELIRLPSL